MPLTTIGRRPFRSSLVSCAEVMDTRAVRARPPDELPVSGTERLWLRELRLESKGTWDARR